MNKKAYKIVTHSGQFHPDEIFAIAMLKYYFCEINEIVRTRDEEIIEEAFMKTKQSSLMLVACMILFSWHLTITKGTVVSFGIK